MLADSKAVVDPKLEDERIVGVIVYEGFLTQLITGKLNLSVPYYSSIRRALIRMGCIRQLRRGGGSSPSQWEMIYEPTEEAFMKQIPTKVPKQTAEAQTQALLDQCLVRIAELESVQEEIIKVLAEKFGTEEVKESE